ncbi:MAG TPA: MGMT family protein [Burkholderiales bacterium]|nr:MGMT family protein [Burkholderiales bacterium]
MKLAPQGTPFQRKVWKAIAQVAFGKTIAYAELARRAGRPARRASSA